MITFTQGNLLESGAQAVVNTVNTVGVMGKGIALMFKERFPLNFSLYDKACKAREVATGHMFVTETGELEGPKWIVNFPTKQHWRGKSQLEWIVEGLHDLRRWIVDNRVTSIALPPLGAGNGGLNWADVRPHIEAILVDLEAEIFVYEPTSQYQNVQKRAGVEQLTIPRALISDLVRRYSILGMDCSLLEIQKLTWFLDRSIAKRHETSPLGLRYVAHLYGPFANNLQHMLNSLDGSYIHCDKRISDAGHLDTVWFNDGKEQVVSAYLHSEGKAYLAALEDATRIIEGFESPFGMELLATSDWLLHMGNASPTVNGLREALQRWPAVRWAVERKNKIFSDEMLALALDQLTRTGMVGQSISAK